jgi:peptidoglycan/LPS O-acetylase OafA/YrhL
MNQTTIAVPPPVEARVPELDGIRGMAILMVLVWHFIVFNIPHVPGTLSAYVFKSLLHLYSGVDLFFVLSGFLISRILLTTLRTNNGLTRFYIRRTFRILPTYAVWLAVVILLSFVVRSPTPSAYSPPSAIWPYFIFLQNFEMAALNNLGNWGISWSLAVEEQFYLLLPFLLLAGAWRRPLILFSFGFLLSTALRFTGDPGALSHFTLLPYRLDGFAAGGIIACLSLSPKIMDRLRGQPWIPRLVAGVGAAGLIFITIRKVQRLPYDHSVFSFAYAALLLLCITGTGGFVATGMRWGWLRFLGIISYPLYLFHELIKQFFNEIFPANSESWTLILVAMSASVLFAWALHKYFGEPMHHFGRRLARRLD